MQSLPLVSVICLCHNHQEYVTQTLDSVLNQSYPHLEIIIVDDLSTDNSVKVIEDWLIKNPNALFIKNKTNLGITKSFNHAVKKSHGAFLIDLACDDLLLEHCINEQVAAFLKTDLNTTAMVYGNAININSQGDFISYFFEVDDSKNAVEPRKSGNIYKEILSGGNCMNSVSAMHNRIIFEQLNGYDESLYYEDLDYWIRASRKFNIYYIDTVWVKKRKLNTSLGSQFSNSTNSGKKINSSTLRILKNSLKLNHTKEEDAALLKRIHYEITQCFKRRDYLLLLRYLVFKSQLFLVTNTRKTT